jgi:hypothetical protein
MKAYMLEVLLGLALVLPFSNVDRQWNHGYHFRRSVRINHAKLPFDEPNFPVLIDASAYGHVAFAQDAFGYLPLHAEPDKTFNGTYFVTLPIVSHSTDTVFYMFYTRDKP